MITKGIVEKVLNKYTVKVRMPIFDAVKEARDGIDTEDLSTATICTLPNSDNIVLEGDIVFVAFEDNDYSKPVIIGHLFKETLTNTFIDLKTNNFTTFATTTLDKNTYIGKIKPSEINKLSGIRENIQDQIDRLENLIEEIRGML